MTANLDDNIGRLKKAIQDMGMDENTIFVFTSDHGELFWSPWKTGKKYFSMKKR